MGFLIVDNEDYLHRPLGDGSGDRCCECHIEACESNRHTEIVGTRTAGKICDLIEENTYQSHIRAEVLVQYSILAKIHDVETGCHSCDHWRDNVTPETHGGHECCFPEGEDLEKWKAGSIQDRDNTAVAGTQRRRLDDRIDAVNIALRIKHGIPGGERSLIEYDREAPQHSADMRLRFAKMGKPLPERVGPKEQAMRKLIRKMKQDGEI